MEVEIDEHKIKYKGTVSKIYSWNLYVPGIRIGVHDFKRYNKRYAYVNLPDSDIWVFLRTAIFLEVVGLDNSEPQYVIVHNVGLKDKHGWDLPKGQVEYKEYETIKRHHRTPQTSLRALLKEGIRRELEEEAKIKIENVQNLKELTYLAVAGKHKDLPNHFHYQYHLFEGQIHYSYFNKAKKTLDKMRLNPTMTINMSKDVIEKDNIMLWSPSMGMTKIEEGDPQKLVSLYLAYKGVNST